MKVIFSALMILASLFIAANRFATGHEYWGAFWLFVAFANVMAIYRAMQAAPHPEGG